MAKKAKKKKEFDLDKFIIQRLRGAFRKSPLYSATKNKAKDIYYVKSKHGKDLKRVRFQCAKCGKFFDDKPGSRNVHVDHVKSIILPEVGPVRLPNGSMDWNHYIPRLFCDLSNLQILCKEDHAIKTKAENAIAAERRRKEKEKK